MASVWAVRHCCGRESPHDIGNKSRNKLGTEHPKIGWNTVVHGVDKSMSSKDGRLFFAAHNLTTGCARISARDPVRRFHWPLNLTTGVP